MYAAVVVLRCLLIEYSHIHTPVCCFILSFVCHVKGSGGDVWCVCACVCVCGGGWSRLCRREYANSCACAIVSMRTKDR